MERRAVVGGSLLAGLSTLMSAHDAEAAAAAAGSDLEGVSYSIDQLRKTVERQFANVYTTKWHGVARIREQQHLWMKSTQKYPDFIEIGIDVWDNIYDWHVVHQQPINMTRLTDGRYTGQLELQAYVGDAKENIIGEFGERLDLEANEPTRDQWLKTGIRRVLRIPVMGDAKYVKVVVFDFGSDKAGSFMLKLK